MEIISLRKAVLGWLNLYRKLNVEIADLTKTEENISNKNWILFLVLIIYCFNVMDRQVIGILAEPIRKDLLLTDTQLGLLSGFFFALFYGVCGVPIGWLADRFGTAKVIAFACTVWSLCSASGALASNFLQLAASRVGVAVGEAGGTAPSHALIANKFPPEQRATALAIFTLGIPFGSFFGIILCGWIGETFGWRTAVAVVSLPGVAFAAIFLLTVPDPVSKRSRVAAEALRTAILAFWRSPLLRTLVLAGGATSLAAMALVAWVPAYLMRAKGMTLGELGYYYSVANAIALGLGIYAGGALSDRLGRHSRRSYALVPGISCALGAPLVVLAVLAGSWQMSLMWFLLPIAVTSTAMAPLAALVQNEAPISQRGIYASIYLLINSLIGVGLGPLLVGAVSDMARGRLGDEALGLGIALLSLFMLLAAGLFFRLSRVLGWFPER